MIPKEPGNFKKHRLRIIRLCESDLNQSLAEMLVHPVGKFFEKHNLYPGTQYGSREGCLGVSAVLNKILSYDIARLIKTVMTSVENDLSPNKALHMHGFWDSRGYLGGYSRGSPVWRGARHYGRTDFLVISVLLDA